MVHRIVVPFPVSLDAAISPPCASTRLRAMANPRPAPPESAVLTNRSKMWGRTSTGTPDPESETANPTRSPARSAAINTEPSGGVCRGTERGHGVVDQVRGFDRLTVQSEGSRLRGREGLEVVEQAGHHPALLEHRLKVRPVGVVHAIEDPLHVAADHRQRCAELVGQVGQEVPPLVLRGSQPLRHLVEGPAQPPRLPPMTSGCRCSAVPLPRSSPASPPPPPPTLCPPRPCPTTSTTR